MASEGITDIPVIAIGASDFLFNEQPGFKPNWNKLIKPATLALLFTDSLSRIYYASASREKDGTESKRLRAFYLDKAKDLLERNAYHEFIPLLKEAVIDFNHIPIIQTNIPAVGIVGEIYIKYNSFGQFNMIDWLIENQIEVVLPPLLDFFMQSFINKKARSKEFIHHIKPLDFANNFVEWIAQIYIHKFEKVLQSFRFYRPLHSIKESAQYASEILNLNNQYGEGWLIPAEIAILAKQKVNNIVCIQPFGCISNHIVGKGMEKKIKKIYPDIHLLFIDFDSGTSKINVLNRLQFLIQNIETPSFIENKEVLKK